MCYDKAIELDPKTTIFWINKGLLLGKHGRHKESIVCFDKAIELDPTNEDARSFKKQALDQFYREHLGK